MSTVQKKKVGVYNEKCLPFTTILYLEGQPVTGLSFHRYSQEDVYYIVACLLGLSPTS